MEERRRKWFNIIWKVQITMHTIFSCMSKSQYCLLSISWPNSIHKYKMFRIILTSEILTWEDNLLCGDCELKLHQLGVCLLSLCQLLLYLSNHVLYYLIHGPPRAPQGLAQFGYVLQCLKVLLQCLNLTSQLFHALVSCWGLIGGNEGIEGKSK